MTIYKRLFDIYEKMTPEALALAQETSRAIRPIVQKYLDQDYSSHDIENVIFSELSLIVCTDRIKRQIKRRKGHKDE